MKTPLKIIDPYGNPKYLTQPERLRFSEALHILTPERRLYCQTLLNTGARPCEVLGLRIEDVNIGQKLLRIRSAKKRPKPGKPFHYRYHAMDRWWLEIFQNTFDFSLPPETRFWTFSRWTSRRIIKEVMAQINITGVRAGCRGMRHGVGRYLAHDQKKPLDVVQSVLGHASVETTVGYTLDLQVLCRTTKDISVQPSWA